MTSFDTTFPSPATLSLSRARLTVLTLAAPLEAVFNHLADVENLPRWAGDFCERLWLGREHWTALTSLGELVVVVQPDSAAQKIVLGFGWNEASFRRLTMALHPCPEGTRLKFALDATADETEARFFRAVESALPGLIAEFQARAIEEGTPN
jgi:uncharacterized protein YndB with AHSA1/START domain